MRNSQRPTVKRFIVKVQIDQTCTWATLTNELGDIHTQTKLTSEERFGVKPLDMWFQYASWDANGALILDEARAPKQKW